MKAAHWLWLPVLALATAEALALFVLCESQVRQAESRREAGRMQDAAFGYCLDQTPMSIARCRKRFAPARVFEPPAAEGGLLP